MILEINIAILLIFFDLIQKHLCFFISGIGISIVCGE